MFLKINLWFFMSNKSEKSFLLSLYSPSRKRNYPVLLKHVQDGWEINYFGNKSRLDQECSTIERVLGSDGTRFPPGAEKAFAMAWQNIDRGVDVDFVKQTLERQINQTS